MESLLQKIQKNWEFHQLAIPEYKLKSRKLSKNSVQVIVCVSSGSDSVALFHSLLRLSALLCLKLHILHFNHQLRPEALREQDFVESLGKEYKVPFHCKTAKHLQTGQQGLQESARKWRIDESRNLLETLGGGWIATGHHADDQTETLLLKWLRGSHISNLQGMRWKNTPFIRPLLNCSKLELQGFLKNNNLAWMEDNSNQSAAYLRNRVRLELIPLLEELTRHGLQSRISDLSGQSQLLREWLDSQYDEWKQHSRKNESESPDVLSLTDLEQVSDLLQEEIMHNFITTQTKQALSYSKLQNIFELMRSDSNLWELRLSQEWIIIKSGKELLVQQNSEK